MPADASLANQLRDASRALAQARAARNKLVIEAHASGLSLREIASLVGLSHTGVERITKSAAASAAREARSRPGGSAEEPL